MKTIKTWRRNGKKFSLVLYTKEELRAEFDPAYRALLYFKAQQAAKKIK